MNLIERVKAIVLSPKDTWPVVAAEPATTASLYTEYIMILAAIPAVAGFIGMSLVGIGGFGFSMRVPILTGLVQMVLGYGLSLVMVYVLSLIANALAPKFGGESDPISALKLVAYGSTAAVVGGIFGIVPSLGVLGLVAALYSLYVLYLGVPVLMKVPQERSVVYTVVLIVCAIVVGAISGAVLNVVQGGPTLAGIAATRQVDIDTPAQVGIGAPKQLGIEAPKQIVVETPQGTVSIDTDAAEAWGKKMEAIGKRIEAAQQSGDQAAMQAAMAEMIELQKTQPLLAPKP